MSHTGARRFDRDTDGANDGRDSVHADRDQVEAVKRGVPRGGKVVMLAPELDVSGGLALEQRPSLIRAIEGVERGDYAGIIVAYLSRLGRNVREQLRAWDRVEAAGGRIIVVEESIDTRTPHGRYMRTVLLANAEHEREMHVERFANLRRWATAAGIWQFRQTPRGYARDPVARRLVPDGNAPSVRTAFRRRAAGTSISEIAREIGMTQSGVRFLLRNRVYLGELRVGPYFNPSAHPRLVTEDEFRAVQAVRSSRPPRSGLTEPALLVGLVRCTGCGHVMSRGRTAQLVYSCAANKSAGQCPAPASITVEKLDEHVSAIALSKLGRLEARASGNDGALNEARAALDRAQRERAAYLEAVSALDVGVEAFATGARVRNAAVDDAEERLNEALADRPTAIDGDPVAWWHKVGDGDRNRLLRGLVETVLVAKAGRGKRVPVDQRVRVIARGAGLLAPYAGGSTPRPITPVALPDRDDPRVLRLEVP